MHTWRSGVAILLGYHYSMIGWREVAALVMALPTIGIESALLFTTTSAPARLGLSLYCGMLLGYWTVLTFAPPDGSAGRDRDRPVTVSECQVPFTPARDRSPVHSRLS